MASAYLTLAPRTHKVSHVWKTGIQTTIKGVEKRSMLYTWPRVNIYNEILAETSQEINYLKRKLFKYMDVVWGIPLWMDKTLVSSQAASGQKTINVIQTAYRHFYAGRECILINPNDYTSYEVGTINTIGATQIVVVANLTSTWPVGTWIFPCYDCRIDAEQEMVADWKTAQLLHLTAREAYESLRTFAYSVPASGAATYQSLDLLLNHMHPAVTYKYKRAYALSQFLGLGYGYAKYDSGDNVLGLKADVTLASRADIWSLFNFFDSKYGRLGRLWVPTWSKDIVPTAGILSTDTVLTIEPIEYGTYYEPNDIIGRYIYIQFPDRSYVCRQITDSDATTITLDSAIGTSVLAADLPELYICFLLFCRFGIDELEMDYLQEGVGRTNLSFAGLVGEDL